MVVVILSTYTELVATGIRASLVMMEPPRKKVMGILLQGNVVTLCKVDSVLKVIDVNFLMICLTLFQENLAATGKEANVFVAKIVPSFMQGNQVVVI